MGKDAILNAAAEKAIQKHYPEVISKEKIEPIGAPQAQLLKIVEGSELEYKVTTAVMPESKLKEWEKDIKKINEEHKDKKVEVTDEEVDQEVEKLANSRVQMEDVEREAKKGDNVNIDFQVFQNGVAIENGTSKGHDLVLGKGVFIPGFEENIIGARAGDEKEFELEFPKEYHEKSLAGKPASFKVQINKVQERKTPEISDEFAKSLGQFENLEALKKNIREGLEKEKEKQLKEQKRNDMIESLVEKVEVNLPEVLVHEELHRMIHEFESQIQGMGMQFEDYLKQVGKNKEDLEKDWRPQAEKRIKSAMALTKIAEEKEIDVPQEEVEKEMNKTLEQYKGVEDLEKNVDLNALYNYTKGTMVNEKVFELMEKL